MFKAEVKENVALLDALVRRGLASKDFKPLADALALCRSIEIIGSSTIAAIKPELPNTVIYADEAFKAARACSKKIRSACVRLVKAGHGSDRLLDLYYQSHLFDAPHCFDSFMLYIEKDRPKQQQFWLPRRKALQGVAEALEEMESGELDELFLALPPRVGKTTITVFFLLWAMLRDSERSNLYTSYSDSVVGVFYDGLIEIVNDPYTYLWQDVFPHSKVASTDAKSRLLNFDRRKRYASFTGRSLYGTLNGACDCNGYQVADDLISGIEEAMNKDRLDAAWLKVDNNYLPRGKEGAKRIWIGTRWATRDMQSRRVDLLTNDDRFAAVRWKEVTVPALNEKDESNFEYDYGVGFSSEYYKQRRASFERNNDMASWFAQYQGVPVDRGGSVFEPDDLRYYNGVLPEVDPDRIFMAVDPAWGGGDHVASPVIFQYGNDLYVHDVVYSNADKTVTQPLIVDKVKKYGVQAIAVEATKATSSYTEGIETRLRSEGISINIKSSTKNWTGTGKQQRIFDKAPDIRDRMLFIESGKRSKEYEQFMNNVFAFKIGGNAKKQHDDAPDSLAQAINMAFVSTAVVQIIQRPF